MLKAIIEAVGLLLGATLIAGLLIGLTGCSKTSVLADPIVYNEQWWLEYIVDTCEVPEQACTLSHLCEQPLVVQLFCEVDIHNEALR